MAVQQRMIFLFEPSVLSLRSKGSMRSWCIHDGYGVFLLMYQSTPVRGFDREEETLFGFRGKQTDLGYKLRDGLRYNS
jgi:hypothetical protein